MEKENTKKISEKDEILNGAKNIQKRHNETLKKLDGLVGKRYQQTIKITKVDKNDYSLDFITNNNSYDKMWDYKELANWDLIVDKDLNLVIKDEGGDPVKFNITYEDYIEILLALRQRIQNILHPNLMWKKEELELIHKKIETLALGCEFDSKKIVSGCSNREANYKGAINKFALHLEEIDLPKDIQMELNTELNLILIQNQKLANMVNELGAELDRLLTIPGAEETKYTIIKIAKVGPEERIPITNARCPICHFKLNILEEATPDVDGNLVTIFKCKPCDKFWAKPYNSGD